MLPEILNFTFKGTFKSHVSLCSFQFRSSGPCITVCKGTQRFLTHFRVTRNCENIILCPVLTFCNKESSPVYVLWSIIWLSWGAAIAQWNRLRLPACHPATPSSSPKHTIYTFIVYSICVYICHVKSTKIKKRPGLAHDKNIIWLSWWWDLLLLHFPDD